MSRSLRKRELTALESAGYDARRLNRRFKRERNLRLKREDRRETEALRRETEAREA